MPEIESPKFLAEEIKNLEEKLELKKKELVENNRGLKPEEAAKEVILEYSKGAQSQTQTGDDQLQKAAAKLKDEPHSEQIEELLKISGKEGMLYAVNVAKRLGNPHLLDDFHDRLVLELLKEKR